MKVLIGFIMNGQAGGVDKYLLTFADSVRSEKLKVDFLTNKKDVSLEKMLNEKGSELFEVANLKHPYLQYKQILTLLKENKYDMTYFNISTAISIIGPYAAYKADIGRRAIHSHSSGNDCDVFWKRKVLDIIHACGKRVLYKYGNQFYGCSRAAGYWLFPKALVDSEAFDVIYNAVDLSKFRFDTKLRYKVRAQYNVEDCLVIGHVGNFCYPKNHLYLIKIFAELIKKEPNARLVLVGDGPDFIKIEEQVKQLELTEKVMFLGKCNNVSELYQMMDIFLLPSNFEGLPIVGVEAQGTGLKCLFSDTITDEVKLTKEARFFSIKGSVQPWVECILKEKDYDREKNILLEYQTCYDLKKQEDAYRKIIIELDK